METSQMTGPWEDYQAPQAQGMPWMDYQQSPAVQGEAQSPFTAVKGALSDIGGDTAEVLKNAATQTGQAMSEPMSGKNVPYGLQTADMVMRGLGKVGNAIGGAYGAALSPVQGALTASVENSGVLPAAAEAIKKNLVPTDPRFSGAITPEQQHQVATGIGGDLANAVMLAKAGQQGEATLRQQQGLPPAPKPYDPLAPADPNAPRVGLMASNSSDPMQPLPPSTYSPDEIMAQAKQFYQNGEKIGGSTPVDTIRNAVQGFMNNKDISQQTKRGQLFAGDSPVTQTLADLKSATQDNSPWTVADANEIDDAIRGRIQMANRAGDYASARSLQLIKSGLKDVYQTAAENDPQGAAGFGEWIKGDKLYSAGSAAQEIQDMIANAQKADVPSTAIKNAFKTFVKNDDNRAGLTDEEWAAANQASKTGIVTGALKTIGSKAGSMIAGAASGATGGGVIGAAVGAPLAVAATRPFAWAANARQAARGQNVSDLISQRPAVQALMKENPLASSAPQNSPPSAPVPPTSPPTAPPPMPVTPLPTPTTPIPSATRALRTMPGETGAPMSLSTFIKRNGGITSESEGGDLAQAGHKDLLRANGNNIDDIGEAAHQAGYFAQRPSVNELKDALINSNGGRTSYRDADLNRVLKRQETAVANGQNDPAYVEHYADSLGIDTTGKTTKQLLNDIADKENDIPFDIAARARMGIPLALVGAGTALQQAQQRLKQSPAPAQPPQPQPPAPLQPSPQANAAPLLSRIAQAESGGNPNAKNPNSTASGLLQFTNKTWADMVARYGKQTGITVADKNNPQAQQTMGQLLADDNSKYMTSKLGRQPTDGEIYAAHVLGAPDATKLINAQGSGRQAITLFSRKVTADNKPIFWDNGKPRTVEQVYNLLNNKVAS